MYAPSPPPYATGSTAAAKDTSNLTHEGIKNKASKPTVSPLAPTTYKRNLVVCLDGSSLQFSNKNSNVIEIYSRIPQSEFQQAYYNSGIGTYAKEYRHSSLSTKQMIIRAKELAIASDIKTLILKAYQWLSNTYRIGDQIFFFGFSRGAYQIRALAAMIETVGLLRPGNQEQIVFAWDLYCHPENPSYNKETAIFKQTFCQEMVNLHFLGAWDTVSAVGVVSLPLLPNAELCNHITHFRHALALDERRVRYLPEYVQGEAKQGGTKKEVWFVGTHSDIGGGTKPNLDLDGAGEPLRWMIEEARIAGLSIMAQDIESVIPSARVTKSLKFWWRPLEYLPILRRSYDINGKASQNKRVPHVGRGRKVILNQHVHWTVKASIYYSSQNVSTGWSKSYKPRAALLDGSNRLDWHSNIPDKLWEGEKYFLAALDLIRKGFYIHSKAIETGTEDIGLNDRENWVNDIIEYIEKNKRPEIFWIYGGPWLLNQIASVPTRSSAAHEIIRSVVGLKNARKKTPTKSVAEENDDPKINELEDGLGLDHIQTNVLPRVWLILRQWVEPYNEPTISQNRTVSGVSNIWGIFTSPQQKLGNTTLASEDAQWSLKSTSSDRRSIRLALVATQIVLDLTKIDKIKDAVFKQLPYEEPRTRAPRIESEGNKETQDLLRKHSDVMQVLMLLLPEKTTGNMAPEEIDVTKNIIQLVGELAQHEPALKSLPLINVAPKLISILDQEDVYTTQLDLAIMSVETLSALMDYAPYAVEISQNPQYYCILKYIGHQDRIENKFKRCRFVKRIASVIASMLQRESAIWEEVTEQIFSPMVDILDDVTHPGVKQVLMIIEAVSTQKPSLILTRQERLVKILCSKITLYSEAVRTLANLASHKSFQDPFFVVAANTQGPGSVELVSSGLESVLQVLKSDSPNRVQAALDLIRALVEQGNTAHSREGLDILKISEALVEPLKSRSHIIAQRALDTVVPVVLLMGPANIHNKLIDCLELLAYGRRDLKAALALAGTVKNGNEYRGRIKGLTIPTLVLMMKGVDEAVAEGAITVLTRFAHPDYGLSFLENAGLINVLDEVLKMALDPTSYAYPHTFDGRVRITQAAFKMVERCATDDGRGYYGPMVQSKAGRDLIAESEIIDTIVRLTDGPSSEDIDLSAAKLLVGLKQYDTLSTVIKQRIGFYGPLHSKAMMAFLAEEARVQELHERVEELQAQVAKLQDPTLVERFRSGLHQIMTYATGSSGGS